MSVGIEVLREMLAPEEEETSCSEERKKKKHPAQKKQRNRKIDCDCKACSRPDCGKCKYCLDNVCFGGPHVLRKKCKERRCQKSK